MKTGIKISRHSYKNVNPEFVMWLDKTFPHLNGALSIHKNENGSIHFVYEAFDDKKLTEFDKNLIKRYYSIHVMQEEEERNKMMVTGSLFSYTTSLPQLAIDAMEHISEKRYYEAIHLLLDILQQGLVF